jgi:prepilin-type N-terminal cleavage/methylation domain-containing protein
MRQDGFSLVELITVMTLIGILLAIGTLDFNRMTRKYAVDNQTRSLYTDLMDARLKSMYKKKSHYVKLTVDTFSMYSSVDAGGNPLGLALSKGLKQQITWGTPNTIEFNSQGLTTDIGSICVADVGNPGANDSIVISMTRINMGKRKSDGACKSDDIEIR